MRIATGCVIALLMGAGPTVADAAVHVSESSDQASASAYELHEVTFRVTNERGTPQADVTVYGGDSYEKWQEQRANSYTDPGGEVTLTVSSGSVIRFTREPEPESSCTAPEGVEGVRVVVGENPPERMTVTLPNATDPDQPELDIHERDALWRINRIRADEGLEPAQFSRSLSRAASSYASYLSRTYDNGRIPNGVDPHCAKWAPSVRAVDAGWPSRGVMENGTYSQKSSREMVSLWAQSQAHRSNMLIHDSIGLAQVNGWWILLGGDCAYDSWTGTDTSAWAYRCEIVPGERGAPARSKPSEPRRATRLARPRLTRAKGLVTYRVALRTPAARGRLVVRATGRGWRSARATRRDGTYVARMHLDPGRWCLEGRFYGRGPWRDAKAQRRCLTVRL